jgi:hypothetical protein
VAGSPHRPNQQKSTDERRRFAATIASTSADEGISYTIDRWADFRRAPPRPTLTLNDRRGDHEVTAFTPSF